MSKLGILKRLVMIQLPESLLSKIMSLHEVRGRKMDPKAQLLGEAARIIRGDAVPTVADSRAQMAKMAAQMERPCPATVTKRDVMLPGEAGDRAARIYEPDGVINGTLLFFHGGGWVQCNIDTHDGLCGALAEQAGVRVVSYDYRLAPEHKFPAGLMDCLAVYQALMAGAEGVDPSRLIVGGDSAGANLTAALMHLLANTEAPMPLGQLLIYPAVDARLQTQSVRDLEHAFLLDRARMDWFLELYLPEGQDKMDPRVSALFSPHVGAFPPAFVIVAGHDPLRDDGYAFAEAMTAAGAQAELVEYPGQVHAFLSLTKLIPQGSAAISDCAGWVKRLVTGA